MSGKKKFFLLSLFIKKKNVMFLFLIFLLCLQKRSNAMITCKRHALRMLKQKSSIDIQIWMPMQSYKDANENIYLMQMPYKNVSIDFHNS